MFQPLLSNRIQFRNNHTIPTKMFKEMKKSVKVLAKELHKIVYRYKKSLVGNKTFEDRPVEDISDVF